MPSELRKLSLTLHITSSVGWIGIVIAYLVIATAMWFSVDMLMIQTGWTILELIGWYLLVPMAISALFTGIIMSLGTSWGLFRHYWVLISLLLTCVATIILVQHMPTVSFYADYVTQIENITRDGLGGEFVHAGIGLLVLMVIQILNIYKPRGMTPYGWRKKQENRAPRSVSNRETQ